MKELNYREVFENYEDWFKYANESEINPCIIKFLNFLFTEKKNHLIMNFDFKSWIKFSKYLDSKNVNTFKDILEIPVYIWIAYIGIIYIEFQEFIKKEVEYGKQY